MTLKHPTLEAQLEELTHWCMSQDGDILIADAAQTSLLALQRAVKELSGIRRASVRALAAQGFTHREIATELSLSHGRIDQIIK